MSCLICRKHAGAAIAPPGGYLYQDENWMVCHFFADRSIPGQLVIESKRHVLDFGEMTDQEVQGYGLLLKRLYSAVKQVTGAERVYSVVMLEGIPHFHAHLIPRLPDSPLKGMKLLSQDASCSEEEAAQIADRLREVLNSVK